MTKQYKKYVSEKDTPKANIYKKNGKRKIATKYNNKYKKPINEQAKHTLVDYIQQKGLWFW